MFGRRKIAIMVAEFLSAAILSMVVLSMVGRTNFPLFPAIAAGLTVGVLGYLFGSQSNPAVTIGLWTMRKVQTLNAIVAVAMQFLGGFAAWQLSEYLLNNQLRGMAGDSFDWRVLLAEALGGFVLGLGVAVVAARVSDVGKRSVAEGVSLAIGILVASLASNGIVNPAVALGVQSWSWAYAVGPILGAVIGMSLYGILFAERVVVSAVNASSADTTVTTKRATTKKPVRKAPAKTTSRRRK